LIQNLLVCTPDASRLLAINAKISLGSTANVYVLILKRYYLDRESLFSIMIIVQNILVVTTN